MPTEANQMHDEIGVLAGNADVVTPSVVFA
jgi:hypothetical protein